MVNKDVYKTSVLSDSARRLALHGSDGWNSPFLPLQTPMGLHMTGRYYQSSAVASASQWHLSALCPLPLPRHPGHWSAYPYLIRDHPFSRFNRHLWAIYVYDLLIVTFFCIKLLPVLNHLLPLDLFVYLRVIIGILSLCTSAHLTVLSHFSPALK